MRLYKRFEVYVNSVLHKCKCNLWKHLHCNGQKMSLLHSAICTCLSPSFSNDIQMYTYLILRRVDSMTFSGRCCTRQTAPHETDSGSLYWSQQLYLQNFHNLHGRQILLCYIIILYKHKQNVDIFLLECFVLHSYIMPA